MALPQTNQAVTPALPSPRGAATHMGGHSTLQALTTAAYQFSDDITKESINVTQQKTLY